MKYEDPLNKILRGIEKNPFNLIDENNKTIGISIFSIKDDQDLTSILAIVRTTYLIFVLACASIYFAKDSNEMVVDPIERMLKKIKMISENPLEAARIAEDEAVAE